MGNIFETARAQQATREGAQRRAEAEAKQQRSDDEARWAKRDADMAARHSALQETVIPELLIELTNGLGHSNRIHGDLDPSKHYNENSGQIRYTIESSLGGSVPGAHYDAEINVNANPDGSIRINDRTLSAQEARDPRAVERVLDNAYRNPHMRETSRPLTDEENIEWLHSLGGPSEG